MRLKLLAVAAALVASNAALAKTENLGNLTPPDVATFDNWFYQAGSFNDTFTFTLDKGANAIGGTFDFDLSFGQSIDLTSISLTGTGLSAALVDSSPLTFSFSNLVAGTYSLVVSGVAIGNPLGKWDMGGVGYKGVMATTTVAAPVPEPGTIAMMALGLGAVGFVARRRQNAGK